MHTQLGEHTVRTLNESGINVILDGILTEDSQELFNQIKVFDNCFD